MNAIRNYGQFVIAVIKAADRKSGYSLSRLLGIPISTNILDIISIILGVGWSAFVAVCGLLVLGPIAFGIALAAFIAGGIGALVVAALALYGGFTAIQLLYQYKTVPLIVYRVGKSYKTEFELHKYDMQYVEKLVNHASDLLIEEANRISN